MSIPVSHPMCPLLSHVQGMSAIPRGALQGAASIVTLNLVVQASSFNQQRSGSQRNGFRVSRICLECNENIMRWSMQAGIHTGFNNLTKKSNLLNYYFIQSQNTVAGGYISLRNDNGNLTKWLSLNSMNLDKERKCDGYQGHPMSGIKYILR